MLKGLRMDTAEKFETSKGAHGAEAFPVAEKGLPRLLGCQRDQPAKVRYLLEESPDRQKVGRSIRWTLAAVREYATSRGMDWRLVAGLGDGDATPAAPVVTVLKTTACKTLNPHILLATDGAQLLRVRVRKKDNFRPGMEVRCTRVSADLYDLIANCPRFPGKY